MDDYGRKRDGILGGPVELRGEGDGLESARGTLREDLVDRALACRLSLTGEQGHGDPGDAVAATVGPSHRRPLIGVEGQDLFGYALHPRPRAERRRYRIDRDRVHGTRNGCGEGP